MSERPLRKVLHVLNGAGGGAALSTIDIMRLLREEGIESAAVCHDAGSPEERERLLEAAEGRVIFRPLYWWNEKNRARLWKRPLLELWQLWRTRGALGSATDVAKFARAQQADLVHTNTILTPEGGVAAAFLGLPHVWHLRELVGPGHPFRFPIEGRWFGRTLAALASLVVANSEASAGCIAPWVPDGLVRVVPNAIDVGRFLSLTPPPSVRAVGMIGNVTSRMKEHALFVRAAGRVAATHDVSFRIYGHCADEGSGDPYAEEMRALQREVGLHERLTFAGFVGDPVRIMNEIDLLVHPASEESFGRIVIEAMAAQRPVVVPDKGGAAESVLHGVTGLRASSGDVEAFASAIRQIIDEPGLGARFGAGGRSRVLERYSLPALKTGILEAYRAAMDRPLGLLKRSLAALSLA